MKSGIFNVKLYIKKPRFFQHYQSKWKYLLLFHDWFPVKFEFIFMQYFFGMAASTGGVL